MASNPYDQFDANPYDQFDQPAAVEAGATIREVPRQVGLASRYAIEGLGALPATIANVPGMVANAGLSLADSIAQRNGYTIPFRFPEQNAALSSALTQVGFPEPQGANERVVGDMSRTLASAGGVIGGARALATRAPSLVTSVSERVAAAPGMQAAAAVGAGGAGGAVREAGGGPTEQFIASVLGGLVTGGGASLLSKPVGAATNAVQSWVQKTVSPRDIQGTLNVELQRAGVDWNALSQQAQAQLVKDAERAIYSGQPLNPDALRRLADYRNIGATPLVGDITQDPRILTNQRNLSKTMANTEPVFGPNLPAIENQNAKTVLSTLEGVEKSPLDAFATGQRVQGNIVAKDAQMKAGEDALYRAARDTTGREIPLDRGSFVDQAWANLNSSNRAPWLPPQIRDVLNTLSKGDGEFTVNTIDQLKTLLAQESRATTNGNTKAAIAAVRDALENVQPAVQKTATGSQAPITGAQGARLAAADQAGNSLAGDSLAKFDAARAAARERRTWQESAGFIGDALDGTDPLKFTQKHIVNAEYENLAKLRTEMKADPEAVGAVRKQLLDYILQRGRADSDTTKFTSAGLKAGLDQIGERKLRLFFSAAEVQQIKSAVNVARYSQSQPIGSAVNNSNSGAMVIGRLFNSLLNVGKGAPLLGPMVAEPISRASVSIRGASTANVPNALFMQMPPEPFPLNPLLALPALPSRQQ